MIDPWHVFLTGGTKIPWALDEDLRQVREALGRDLRARTLPSARVVHAAWPAAIASLPARALEGKFVVCQADNPPSFYLGTPEFAVAARRVDLWVARSREALRQFELLGLPAALVPYSVDRTVFRPVSDREGIRSSLGLAREDFVVGNFHRDTEGEDLAKPKRQKGPDVILGIAKQLRERVPSLKVLLAGPRRHWLLRALRREGVPVVFAGGEPGDADDYPANVLSRQRLNELYQAMDCCLIASRWEGGPYAVLESLASGTPVVGTPVGTIADVLPQECIFRTGPEAAGILEQHARSHVLVAPCAAAAKGCEATHGLDAQRAALLAAYGNVPRGGVAPSASAKSALGWIAGKLWRTPAARHESIDAIRGEIRTVARPPADAPWPWFTPEGDLAALKRSAAQIAAVRGT